MGGGLLQIAANSAIDPIFNDPNFTLFLAVYHKYTPFTIQDYTLKLSGLSDFGKKLEVTIPRGGDLLTDMVLTLELPKVTGEYIFANQTDYVNNITGQYTFNTMNNIPQYNENLYKLGLGNTMQVYLVRDSQINKYQLMLPLLDATMFLTQGKPENFSLTTFLETNSQFFDNQYNLHVIQNLNYQLNSNPTNIDYLNYAFQDKEFYFFIANLLNIKELDPIHQITYYEDWTITYYNTVKKYILRRPEIIALNTFIENMNAQIQDSIQINNYVFNYPSIFSVAPLDNQYTITLPITLNYNYYLTYKPFEPIINSSNYVLDWTTSFFSIFNRRYILVKRNGTIIGAATIFNILDTNPLQLVLRPFRHIYTNKLLNNNNFNLFIYYGFDNLQFEPRNFAMIASYKLNINQLHEFTLDRSIEIEVGSIIIIGINSSVLPNNNYNEIYGIFQINQVRKSFTTIDQFTLSGYNTVLSATPIEIDQILNTDTILINTNSSITSNTFYTNYNSSVASTISTDKLISLMRQNIYSDVSINTIIATPINSVSQYLLNQIVNTTDFLLTSSIIPTIQSNIQTYISDSYNVLFNYIKNIYYKTVIKSQNNQDYLNNVYFTVNYHHTNNNFNFIGAGTTSFSNLVDGVFRYQLYINDIINSQISNDGQYTTLLSYTNFLTSYIINQYQSFSISYTNDWSASILNIGQNLSDPLVKILNYIQAGNTSGLQTLINFTTTTFSFTQTDLTNLTITYNKKDVTPTSISDYYSVTYPVPVSIVTINSTNSIIIDMTELIASIEDAFNFQNIDLSSIKFNYTTSTSSGILNVINITNFLDNYTTNLIAVVNSNTNITAQLYGNNIILDYINTQNDTLFGLMKNYELSRQLIIRYGGTKYSTYQEDIIDQNPLLVDNTFLLEFLSEEYYPRFLYSKQTQLYQNIYQKVSELSQNYATVTNSIYFMNNINYVRTDGYNYLNNSQGSIPYLDPNQIPTILNSTEYAYTLLDKVSIYTILPSPPTFSFMHYLEELEEHVTPNQQQYLQTYWNNLFSGAGVNTTTTNNYVAALSGKDDALLIYYIYKYLTELLAHWGDIYNLPVNLDKTYFQTIYQLSPNILGNALFNMYSFMMQTTEFPMTNTNLLYELYNSIIQGSTNLYTVYNSYGLLPQYNIQNNTNFNNDLSNLVQEISYLFQVTTRLLGKYKINVVLIINSGLQLELSNYPIVNSIHGSGYLVKIILVSDQYSITSVTNTNFNSSIAYPTGYYVSDYYRLFNLSMHYDFQKYMFFAGYGGILRDSEYPNKTLASFYQKINNYLTSNLNTVDFSIFYAYQTGSYFPNMEGHLIQSYQAWIQRSAQPYFYYYNLLTQFNDMMYGYSGKTFISEYYTVDTNNNTYYNNRHDNIQGVTIYATRMAYGTRDVKGRLNNISKRYNLLDQRLVSIDNNFKHSTVINYDGNIDPIQIFNMLNILNQRFTDYQEFLVLIKNSMNVTGSYPNSDIYSTILTQYKVNSVSMFDLNIFNDWNSFLLNYYTTYNYNYSSLITGLSTTINLYNTMSSTTLDMSSLGYELYSFTNNFASVNQRNFADSNLLRYENATVYHNLIDQLNTSISTLMYFPDKDSFDSDVTYWNSNYSLVSLNFLDISIDKIMSLYQSDVAGFKQLFTSILNYRQKNVSTTAQTQEQIQLYNDYYSINDVTSLTFYDKFYKFNSATDYNLLPLVYHDIYNIQNASNTVVFYLNYLFSFLNNGSSKPNIGAYDDPTLPVSYYFPKYLSSGIDYFLANFHQLKFDSAAFYPYKSVPSQVTLYDGTKVERPKSFMYVFLLLKIQYRNYYYNTVDNAYLYSDQIDQNGNPVRQIIQLNTYTSYPDINADVVAFDGLVDSVAISGSIDHLQTITHPFLVNKHMDNLLFIKDLLNDLITVSDNATIYTILPNNDNYVEFLNEKTIVTNAFDNSGLIFGQYPYTLGVLSSYNYIGEIPIITPTGQNVNAYIEGNVVLPSLITQIYYFLISECFMLNQTELIGSSFQNTPMSLGNILGQLTAKDWKSGLINLISEYLFLILKSKKIIYQNSLYEISFSDIYNRIKVSTNSDKINDFLDMFINSLLTIKITTTNIATSYLAAYEQFKIPNIFSPINIKQNYNYSQYYRLMFALRQSIVGSYTTSTTITINNFQERVQFHNAYDYWLVNNVVLINDYTIVSYNNNNYMIRKSENSDQIPGVVPGLNYYYNNSTNIPPNLFTTIIDYIITNIQNGIVGSSQNKYNFQNFVYVKNGTYQITMTLYNVYFTTNDQLYTIIIDIIAGTVQGIPTSGTGQPFIINYNNLPFGYQYDFINNGLIYQQLLYQSDISIIENMFLIFKNIQDINQSLTTLTLYSTPYTSDSMNMSNFNFMNFASFIESFIQYDFTSKVTNPILVLPVIIPASSPLNVTTLFNITLTNWTKFYGNYYYLYDVSDPNSIPTSANYLGSSNVQYINNIYSGSIYITFKTAGLHYLCLTNALIDSKNPFGSSIVAVRFVLPISTSVISDGSIDNNTAIITIPQTITVNLFNWPSSINITQLYTYFSLSPDGNVDNLQNAAGVVGVGNGPFNIIRYLPSNSNVYAYKIITNLTFNTNTSYYLYVSEKPTAAELSNALVYTLIPNITKQETINVATDIDPVSKICTISPNVIYQGLSQLITIKLINWFSYYNINNLYVYLADNPNGNNLGNDQGDLNVPQAYAQIINSTITFNVSIRYLTNYYVYLTYNQISDYPYGSRPVNFIVNPTDPISVRNITGVTGNINISSVIVNRSTNFIITLGNWLASYTTYGINKLYAYYKDINDDPNNYLNYKPFNTTPYSIILTPNGYQVNITYTLTMNMQANIFLTYNPISSTYPYGTGVVNVMVTQTITTTNQMVITSLTPNTNVPTFTNTTFIGTVLNTWNPILLPYHLNVFIGKTITSSTPVATTVTIINSVPNYGFVVDSQIQASQYNNSNIAFSDSTTYGSGYIETNLINFSTIIGNINANFVQFYVFNNIPFTFNIQLNNWDSTYNINNVFVYVVDNSNNLLFDFGSQSVQLNNNKYYLQFTATPTGFDPDTYYNVYISDTDFNISGYKFKQLLTNQLYIIRDQISISSILTTPYQFKTYASTIFNGQLANWLPTVYPSNLLNVLYTDVYTNITTTVPITINNDGTFSFTTTINTLPGITVLLSDSISYIKSNSYPINSIIGNINTTMATTSVIQGITTNVIITLTNWNPSYNVSSLYIYVGSDQNTPLEIYGANPDLIYLDTDLKYKLSVNITPTLALGTYSIFLSNTNPSNIFYKIRQLITNSFEITGLSMYSFYFDPSNVSGMIAWLDASTIYNLIINNDLIIQWSDTSGNNNNATNSSNYPVYDSINLGVNFSGGNYLILPDGTIPYNNDSYSIYVVLTPSSNTQFILGSVDDVNNLNNLGINSTNTFWTNNNTYYQSWNNNLDLVSSYTPNVKQIVLFEYINGGDRTTYINGVNSGSDTPNPRASTKYNNLIGGLLENNTFTNLIHEIIIYSNPLTMDDKNNIENYLSSKWDIVKY